MKVDAEIMGPYQSYSKGVHRKVWVLRPRPPRISFHFIQLTLYNGQVRRRRKKSRFLLFTYKFLYKLHFWVQKTPKCLHVSHFEIISFVLSHPGRRTIICKGVRIKFCVLRHTSAVRPARREVTLYIQPTLYTFFEVVFGQDMLCVSSYLLYLIGY